MILYQSRHYKQLQHVVEEVKNSFFNTYARQYATYPDMDLFQLHFTYLFMNHKNVSEHLREVHCVCQALIQMALDSHDEVGTEDVHDDLSFKNRQLTILSGDYFSSYYYFYLANKEQPELIPTYSEAIKEVNECKTELHDRKDKLSVQERIMMTVKARSRVIGAVLTWFQAEPMWYELYKLFVQHRLYLEEKMPLANVEDVADQIAEWMPKLSKDVREELQIWQNEVKRKYLVTEP